MTDKFPPHIQVKLDASLPGGLHENTSEFLKNLNDFSDIAVSPSFDYSRTSEIDESFLVLQPTNSILSILPDSDQLVSNIKQKNLELQQHCSEKLNELRNTTKEFCVAKNITTYQRSVMGDSTDEKSERKNKKFVNKDLEKIINDLASLRGELSKVSQRLDSNQRDMTTENDEHMILVNKMKRFAEEKEMKKNMQMVCNCIVS